MSENPEIEALFGEAQQLIGAGRMDEAEARLKSLRSVAPGDARLAPLEIAFLQRAGRFQELVGKYRNLLKAAPDDENLLVGLSLAELQAGNTREACDVARRAQKLYPNSIPVLQALAVSAMEAKDWAAAARCFRVVAAAQPDNALVFEQWSRAEFELGNPKRAIRAFERYLDLTPEPAGEDYFRLGRLYFIAREPEAAARLLDKAEAKGFKDVELHAMRAHCHIHASELDEAKARFKKALALDPGNLEAHIQYRQMVKTSAGDPIFEDMEALKKTPDLDLTKRIHLGFLLGNLYQGIGEFDEAFENYRLGNEATAEKYAAEGFTYDPAKAEQEIAALQKTFPRPLIEELAVEGSPDERPVFIAGMPRSGTTLLEQIIASHSRAEGRGELDAMHFIHFEFNRTLEADPGKDTAAVIRRHREEWQKRYLDALAGNDSQAQRLTDKMPANTRSVGLIAMLFPKAKIIHIRRDPRDVAISIYCNIFDRGHPYATSLGDIGHAWRLTSGLMDYWKETLPVPVLDVTYENLVTGQEAESRRVIEFCGLEWEPQCLDFHQQKKAAITMSLLQVRQPMTAASIGKWKRFEKFLDPLYQALGEDLMHEWNAKNPARLKK